MNGPMPPTVTLEALPELSSLGKLGGRARRDAGLARRIAAGGAAALAAYLAGPLAWVGFAVGLSGIARGPQAPRAGLTSLVR